MKQKNTGLTRRYVAALREHLKPGSGPGLQPALRLGCQAAALGLEMLDLARIHEQALATLELSSEKNGQIRRAEFFFTEAITPIVATHRASRSGKADLNLLMLNATLDRRTAELAATNRRLRQGVVRRKVMKDAYEKSGRHRDQCLKESLQLQRRLRLLTHKVLAAQEDERRKISHELQDEIAQTLLGINVRLLSMKQEARSNTKGLKKEIASTQRLVAKSAKSVRRFARELNLHQKT